MIVVSTLYLTIILSCFLLLDTEKINVGSMIEILFSRSVNWNWKYSKTKEKMFYSPRQRGQSVTTSYLENLYDLHKT